MSLSLFSISIGKGISDTSFSKFWRVAESWELLFRKRWFDCLYTQLNLHPCQRSIDQVHFADLQSQNLLSKGNKYCRNLRNSFKITKAANIQISSPKAWPNMLENSHIYWFFCVAYSISSVVYYPARVGNVLGSERIYGGGLPLPSPTSSLYLGPGRIWIHNRWRESPML